MTEASREASPFEEGFEAGIERAARYDLEVPYEALDGFRDQLSQVLEDSPEDLSDRFVAFYSEAATVASIARVAYEDAALEEGELREYLDHSVFFFNSFRHR